MDSRHHVGLQVKIKGDQWNTVKIRKDLWFTILEYRKMLGLENDFNHQDETFLFLNYKGEPLTHWYIRKLIAEAAAICVRNKKVTPHWFRHTSASLTLANGAGIQKVMEQFGWTNLKTPQRYLHNTG